MTANINIVPRRETKATRALLNELAAARAAIYHGVKQEAPCSVEIASDWRFDLGTPGELQSIYAKCKAPKQSDVGGKMTKTAKDAL